jgi:DNA polymerase V
MLAAVTELPAARASRPSPDPPFRPAGEPERGWPLLATPVPAGFPSPADDFVERRLSLDEHLIRDPESTFFVRVAGDAWRALGVRDGDLLVVDRAAPPTAGSLVVVAVEGTFALRRLGRDPAGRPTLEPADAASGDGSRADDPPDGATFELWGVARWAVHRLWPARDRSA